MLSIPSSELAFRALKQIVRDRHPEVPSSHLTEALAAAAGARTQASLRVRLDNGRSAIALTDAPFLTRLAALGHPLHGWPGFRQLSLDAWTDSPHRSSRAMAWRNMMAAAINAGLCQGLFDLTPAGMFWPGAEAPEHGRHGSWIYDVPLASGIPARAYVLDIGWGELTLHVAFWPTDDDWLRASGAGFYAGEAVASGWFERTKGAWLQADRRGGGPDLSMRRHRTADVLETNTIPMGYFDHGQFFM